ncbi:hypothetical protein M9458_036498, partial [Cirrhinus mrigala]
VGDFLEEVTFIELQREEAEELVKRYNEEGRKAGPPPEKRFDNWGQRRRESSYQQEAIRTVEDLEEATGEVITVMAIIRTAGEVITETGEMDTAAAISLEEATVTTAMGPITKRDIT